MSSALSVLTWTSGIFSVALGVIHISIPVLVRYRAAIGTDEGRSPLGSIGFGPTRYALRRTDLLGITWVMSNAASYVLVTIGAIDIGWASGGSLLPVWPMAAWIAGWWALRAMSQLALGRRTGDVVVLAWFLALAGVHVAIAING